MLDVFKTSVEEDPRYNPSYSPVTGEKLYEQRTQNGPPLSTRIVRWFS